jgi:hypothetical protein
MAKNTAAETIRLLREENAHLRDVVFVLSATVLRTGAVNTINDHYAGSKDVRHLLSLAEECFRCAGLPGLKPLIAEGLKVAAEELMAKAVEVETKLQREQRDKER